jgi:hypothetical protein
MSKSSAWTRIVGVMRGIELFPRAWNQLLLSGGRVVLT